MARLTERRIFDLILETLRLRVRWFSLVEYQWTLQCPRKIADGGQDPPIPDPRWRNIGPWLHDDAPPHGVIKPQCQWTVEDSGIMRLPFLEEPRIEWLAAVPMRHAAGRAVVLWLATTDMPDPPRLVALKTRLLPTLPVRHTWPRRANIGHAHVTAERIWQFRKQQAHALSGSISDRLLVLWLNLASTIPEPSVSLKAALAELELIRSRDIQEVARNLYPVSLEWSLREAVHTIFSDKGPIPILATGGFRRQDNPLESPYPYWFRLAILDTISLAADELNNAGTPAEGIRLDAHGNRVHVTVHHRQPQVGHALTQTRALVSLLGGLIGSIPRITHICIPIASGETLPKKPE
ncbi:hypothetical protein [Sulfobacillus harzensis]|uniref:Uncharacterized protein n=1 Tax=Sulfobacillus harzensis TaxID=2729629 RepID=A0A7Y0L444_9FIRM|nr:hypothetical protein [Sulfobacillus harzensis]NMP22958.1 hypothetical protein [Sulfobacillus harzensis]